MSEFQRPGAKPSSSSKPEPPRQSHFADLYNPYDGEAEDDLAATFGRPTEASSWVAEESARAEGFVASALVEPYRDERAVRRYGTQRSLEEALVIWWSEGRLPGLPVLRDGLLMLEAGQPVEESHRSLLLRTALHHHRGMVTALKHQRDPERTALILREALVNVDAPLSLDELARLQREDPGSARWLPHLEAELAMSARTPDPARASLANAALLKLALLDDLLEPELQEGGARRLPGWVRALLRVLGLILLALLVAALIGWFALRTTSADAQPIPQGDYVLPNPDDTTRAVTISAFEISTHEVTVAEYAACVARGRCSPPVTANSATRAGYFTDGAFAAYPVVTVTAGDAEAYCAWQGGRLPTESEWQVAASYSVALQRAYRYPWGDRYEPGRANNADVEVDDTLQVGHYHPSGDSAFGVTDMAGNVAEWTLTASADVPGTRVVKGGSYADDGSGIRSHLRRNVAATDATPWLGFRCVWPASGWW